MRAGSQVCEWLWSCSIRRFIHALQIQSVNVLLRSEDDIQPKVFEALLGTVLVLTYDKSLYKWLSSGFLGLEREAFGSPLMSRRTTESGTKRAKV